MMAAHRWRRVRGALRVVPTVVGCLVLVLLGDLVIGALLGRGDPPAPPADLLLPGPTDVVATDEVDPRVNAVGMGGATWSEDYWNQFHSLDYKVVPFLYTFQEDSDLPYIKVRNGIRHSYQQADLPADAPVVWFFGGSTMWGEGNRDLYTIPSQFARLAEAEGVPVRVVNYGERGRPHWEEMIRFERALAEDEPPDLVVFYDGANDMNVQNTEIGGLPGVEADPTIFNNSGVQRDAVPPPLSAPEHARADTWYDNVLENSVLLRLAGDLGLESPASADDEPVVDHDDLVARTLAVYERGQAISGALARRAGVEPLYFWQPQYATFAPGGPPAMAAAALTPPTIDLTDVFDGYETDEVYIDGVHTNELGTEVIARSILPYVLEKLGQTPPTS